MKLADLFSECKKLYKKNRDMISAVAAIVFLYVFFYVTGIGCPLKYFTGISCAGCGMTRAWFSLLHLDFSAAFYYHPLFFMPPIVLFVILMKKYIPDRWYKILLCTFVALFVIVYVYRMFFLKGDVICFEPRKSFIYKIIVLIRRMYNVLF